jgi:hypothetical protein
MPWFATTRWFVVAAAMAPVMQKVVTPATAPLRDAYLSIAAISVYYQNDRVHAPRREKHGRA